MRVMDRTPFLITWYTAADESGASSLDQDGIKKLTSYNENLFFRILSAHIAQDKDKSVTASNNYIKLCLRKISGRMDNGTSSPQESSSSAAVRNRPDATKTGTPSGQEAQRRKDQLLSAYRPRNLGSFPTTFPPASHGAPPPDNDERTRPVRTRTERTQTEEPEDERMEIDGVNTDDVEMREVPYYRRGPLPEDEARWERALDRALADVNDQLQDAGVQVDLVERGQTVTTQTDNARQRNVDMQTEYNPTGFNMGVQADLHQRGIDSGTQYDNGMQDASTSVEIGHFPNNQASFEVRADDLNREGELTSRALDYLPEPGPITAVIDRDVPGPRQVIDLPDILDNEPGIISRVEGPVSYDDVEPERLEAVLNSIPPPAAHVDDIPSTDEPTNDVVQENLRVDVLPGPGESETEAIERVARPIFDEYNQAPPSRKTRLNISLERRRRLADWRARNPIQRPTAPIELEPGFEVSNLAVPPSGDEVVVHMNPPNSGNGTVADPFVHAASRILNESRSEPLETSRIVLEPNINLQALPGSHIQPRDVIFHIPDENGNAIIRPSQLKRRAEHQLSTSSRKYARDNDTEEEGVRLFRRPPAPSNEIELVFEPAKLYQENPLSEDVIQSLRQQRLQARRIRASNNEEDALRRILAEKNGAQVEVDIVTPSSSSTAFFDPKHRTNLLRANLLRRKLYPAKKMLETQRRLAEQAEKELGPDLTPKDAADVMAGRSREKIKNPGIINDMLERLEARFNPAGVKVRTDLGIKDPSLETLEDKTSFEATARRLEEEYKQRQKLKEQGRQSSFPRTGKGVAIHHAAKTIFQTLMNPATSDDRFNMNVRMLNQVTKHWPPQPAHDTVTSWSQIFAQNPRGQTLTVDPYERQLKINSLFKLVHGDQAKLYPYVHPKDRRGGGSSKHHPRQPHIICPDGSSKHYRDRHTLGSERLSRILPDECFYHPVLTFGGEYLNRVC